MTDSVKKKIVILGGGFGGAYCAQELEKQLDRNSSEIILIDRNNYFTFYPLLVEAGTGDLEPRHAVVSTRHFLKWADFRMAEISGIDFKRQAVLYKIPGISGEQELDYDHLVIALGSVTNLPGVPGLKEYGFEMKHLVDAVALRDRAIQLLEIANNFEDPEARKALLHFVIVGGNFSGVEVAGQFDEFLKQASQLYRNVDASECKVTLIEIQERILGTLDKNLAAFATKKLRDRGIEIKLKTSISEINPDYVVLNNDDRLKTQTVVWCAGIAPNPLVSKLDLPCDKRGYITCEPDLRVKGFDNVWAIGDLAVNKDAQGAPYPATAQHAVGEAKSAAINIARTLSNRETLLCDISSKGTLAALGCRTAVAKVFGIHLSGFWAWFLWRTVYLYKMPGWSRRLRVTLDWTMDLFFKRDYVQLGVRRIDQHRKDK